MAHEINQPIEPSAGLLRAKWLEDICDKVDALSEGLGIEGDDRTTLKDFVLMIAKDNYLDGTRAGLNFRNMQDQAKVPCNTEDCGLMVPRYSLCPRCGNYSN